METRGGHVQGPLPWYRQREYKEDLSEAEKAILDQLRMQERHPAARYEDLPEELQSYISRLQVENYASKQARAVDRALIFNIVGLVLILLSYFGLLTMRTGWIYIGGSVLLIAPWFLHQGEWYKNLGQFMQQANTSASTNEQIKREWELAYLFRVRRERQSEAVPRVEA